MGDDNKPLKQSSKSIVGYLESLQLTYNPNHELDKSIKIEQKGLDVCVTTTTYHYDAFGRRIAKRTTTQNQSKLTPKHEILPYQQTVQYAKNKQQTILMLWDGNRQIQEYSDTHVFTTVYEQNSFAPVARLVWLKQALIDKNVSEKDKQWLTKFNQWVSEQRINPRDRFEYQEDYARKDKLDDILGIKVFYYHNDQLGTPNELTDAKGDVVWAVDFEAWGGAYREKYETQTIGTIEVDSTQLQSIRFQGQFYDSETGLHYNRFRYYDNDVGMFVSRDPIGLMGGDNVFAYAPNPTGWIDPLGLEGVHITETQHYEIIQPGSVRKYVPFFNNPTVNYLDTYTVNSIEFDSNIEGVKITRRIPILYPHNLNSGHYDIYIGTGDDFDNITWEKQSCAVCTFSDGFNVGWTTGLSGAVGTSAGRTVVARYSMANLLKNPKLIWGKTPENIVSRLNKEGYGAVIRASNRPGNQSKIIEVSGHRQIAQIQVSPTSSRHGGGYYKISTSDRGIIKVVDRNTYIPTTGEKATIIYK